MDFEKKAAEVKDLIEQVTNIFMKTDYPAGVSCVAITRMAAGFCRAAGLDIHKSTDMFLTFYKDADNFFGKDRK